MNEPVLNLLRPVTEDQEDEGHEDSEAENFEDHSTESRENVSLICIFSDFVNHYIYQYHVKLMICFQAMHCI